MEGSSNGNASVDVSLKHHQASTYPLLRRLDQQFALEAKLTDYEEGLSRASGLNKTALSSLGDQERRLRELQASLRSSLSTPQGRPPGTAIAEPCNPIAVDPEGANLSQAQAEGKQGITSETVVGPGPQISTSDTTQSDAGAPNNIQMGSSEAEAEGRRQPTAVPDAPTNFHVTEIRQDSFAVVWNANSSDANIVDYEIRYSHSVDGAEKQVLQRCSRWLLKDPLPNGRFVVENLEPGTEYRDIALRRRNSVGWSEFCDPIQSLSTAQIDKDHERRRSKFLYRIGHLENTIQSLKAERQQIPAEQVSLARQMTEMQDNRMLSLHEEMERISSHADDELLSSDLLHGAAQVFTKRTLHRKLLQELTTCRKSIAVWRAEIIDMDKESAELAAEIETKRTHLGERKAALLQFDKRHSIVSGMKHAVSKQPHEMKQYYLSVWKTRVADRLVVQQTLRSVARACRRRIVARAWSRLCSLIKREQAAQRDLAAKPADGIGGKLLNAAEQCLEENLADAARLVGLVDAIQKNEGGDARTGEACPTHLLAQEDQDALIEGRLLFAAGHYQSSLKSFQRVLSKMDDPAYFSGLSSSDAASLYADVNGKIAHAFARLGSYDLAIQYFGRQLSLAEEKDLDSPRTCALLGLGMCYSIGKYDFQHAESFLVSALEISLSRGDREREAIAYEYLAKCCECLNRPADAKQWASKLHRMDTTSWERQTGGTAISRQGVGRAMSELDTLRDRLVNTSAKESRAVVLEVASAHRVKLQRAKSDKEKTLAEAHEQLSASNRQLEELRELLLQIEDELEEANNAKQNVVSRLLQGHAQEVKAQAAKIRLEAEQKICQKRIDKCLADVAQSRLLIRNIQDDIHILEEEMEVEDAPLMQRILEGRKYRCVAPNAANVACDDVTGRCKASGVPCVVASEGNSCYIHSLDSGKLERVFICDKDGSTATITCLFFHGNHVYAGTMDSLVVGWDISTTTQLFATREHEAAVTCLHADDTKIVSGAADKSIIVWTTDGSLIRRVNGHARGVHCIQCGPQWCVSASYGTVFVWDVTTDEESDKIKAVNCKRRFVLPDDRNVTAVQFGQLEVITGDNAGCLSVWWVESGEIQQSFCVHDGSVASLQVDATKAVSAGLDATVAVSDIIRGEVLHRLRGHAAPILAVAFDRKQILSLSSNGEMRYWAWDRPAISSSRRTRKEVRKPDIPGDDFVSIKGATTHENIMDEDGSEAPETSRIAKHGKLMKRLGAKLFA